MDKIQKNYSGSNPNLINISDGEYFDPSNKVYKYVSPILNSLAESLYHFDTPVLVTTADKFDPKIVFANTGFTKMTGYSEAELIGKNPNILQGVETEREVIKRLKLNLIENEHFKGSTVNYRKDGTLFYNQWGIEPVKDESGKTTNYISVHTDVTDFREQQIKLRESEEQLRKEIDQKNKFFNIIAHDLRNPLSGFMTLTNLMFSKGKDISINQMFDMLEKLNNSAQDLNELLSNLLTWSRSQTNKIDIENSDINVKKNINKILSLFIVNADQKNINLINEIRPNDTLKSDEFIFSTILRNLVNNAIKFTEEDGEVRIKLSSEPGFKIISVIDNGIGMNEEKLKKLFLIENKSVSKGTAGEKGTGIGLKLCKELAQKNGGDLKVESSEGNGSSFHWYIAD